MKKKYAIRKKFDRKKNKFVYYPVHSWLGLIWSNFEEDTGKSYPLIGPFGLKTLQPIKQDICFDELEDAKAFIGKLIWESKTESEKRSIIIELALDELEKEEYEKNRSTKN